jgi:hypothetical protein
MEKITIILSIFILVIVSGCSTTKTHIGQLPTSLVEFQQPLNEIEDKYPEVKKFNGAFRCGILNMQCDHFGVFSMPPMDELIDLWGEPDEIKGSIWNLNIINVPLHPAQTYIWYKGDYRIEVTTDSPAVFSYKPHMWYWKWYQMDNTSEHKSDSTVIDGNKTN